MSSLFPGLLAITAGAITVLVAGSEAYVAWRRHKAARVQHSTPEAAVESPGTGRVVAGTPVADQKMLREAQAAPTQIDPAELAAANRVAAAAIENYINTFGLTVTALTVTFDGATSIAKVYGVAKDEATKEKVVLAAGNVQGVAVVEDKMAVDQSQPEAKFYTVVKGDTLLKIAKEFYGSADDYARIVSANRLTLAQSEEIPTGQVLLIPNK